MPIEKGQTENTLALRTVAIQQSTVTRQGFVKCMQKTKCQTKKCLCIKNGVIYVQFKMSRIVLMLQ